MVNCRALLQMSIHSFLAVILFFFLSTTCIYFVYAAPGKVNEYYYVGKAWVTSKLCWADVNTSTEHPYLPDNFPKSENLTCPERLPSMKGPMEVNMTEISMEAVVSKHLDIQSGGHWKPKDCKPHWKVAILIPFRNRHEQLPILLDHLTPMLQRQRLQFAYYVIEQNGTQPFNRGMLFNVGFQEAMKDLDWDCVIFHDVDHLPENDRNYYGCGLMPRHFVPALDKYSYALPYNKFVGGVTGVTVEQYREINGFPNAYWGWGGEDDDLLNRLYSAGLKISRPEAEIGKYQSIPHHHRGEKQFLGRFKLLRYSKERQYVDGLNNLHYSRPTEVSYSKLYTNISVDLRPIPLLNCAGWWCGGNTKKLP